MFSHGNSGTASDLTIKSSFIKTIPLQIQTNEFKDSNRFYVQGELIVSKENFELHNNNNFIDSRSWVNSFVINTKGFTEENRKLITYIEFVAYKLIKFVDDQEEQNNYKQLTVQNQLRILKEMKFQVVNYFVFFIKEDQTNS